MSRQSEKIELQMTCEKKGEEIFIKMAIPFKGAALRLIGGKDSSEPVKWP
jgi:hypothetical protein